MNLLVLVGVPLVLFVVWFFVVSLIINRISERFSLMPSTESILFSVTHFVAIFYLIENYWMVSFAQGVVIYFVIAAIYRLIESFKFSQIEQQINNQFAIEKIVKFTELGFSGAQSIAKVLNLKERNDYAILIPKIIENLKLRNKLPSNIHITPGMTIIGDKSVDDYM
jgi:hypothetical protein